MFGIDWDGDGNESLFDDMVTLDTLEDEEEDDCRGSGTPNGSCLIFVVGFVTAFIAPIIGIVKWLV